METDEGVEKTQESPKKGKGLFLIISIIAALGVIAGGGAFFFLSKSGDSEAQKKENSKIDESVTVAFDPFIVNLSDRGVASTFLKTSLQLEVAGPAAAAKAKAKTPHIRDSVIALLTSKTSDSLITPEGKLQLKDEINMRMNQILGEHSVKNVYITDFVMQ